MSLCTPGWRFLGKQKGPGELLGKSHTPAELSGVRQNLTFAPWRWEVEIRAIHTPKVHPLPPYTRQLGWEGCNMTYTTRPWSSSNNGRSRIKQGVGPDPCVEGCLTFFPLKMRTFHPEAQKVPEFQGARSTAGAKRRRMASKQVATRAALVSSTWTLSCLKGDHPDCSFGQDGVPRKDSFKQGT